MVSVQTISLLVNRIGFGEAYNLPTDIDVDPIHISGTSGRTFGYFHRLVTLENIYKAVEKVGMNSAEFNAYITQMKKDVVLNVINLINNGISIDCKPNVERAILTTPYIIDDALGYLFAITAIELMLSTNRINKDERNAAFKYERLKIDLEGWQNDKGRIMSNGLRGHFTLSLKNVLAVFCPKKGLVIEDANAW